MPKLFLDWMFELNVCINCNKQEFLTVGNSFINISCSQ